MISCIDVGWHLKSKTEKLNGKKGRNFKNKVFLQILGCLVKPNFSNLVVLTFFLQHPSNHKDHYGIDQVIKGLACRKIKIM